MGGNIVSILLLLELPWWLSNPDNLFHYSLSFNPSFTGIALVASGVPIGAARALVVSILLLLELPWWPDTAQQSSRKTLVSILLLLELPWWPCAFAPLRNPTSMFQSFFYWNCLGGPMELTRVTRAFLRFNPSFTGIALVATFLFRCLGCLASVSILLLLELPWWLNFGSIPSKAISSFNPSFTGIALVAEKYHVLGICRVNCFNPSFTGIALVAFSAW